MLNNDTAEFYSFNKPTDISTRYLHFDIEIQPFGDIFAVD